MYKVKFGLVPSNVGDIFSVKSSKYRSRNMNFHLPRFNSVRYGKHSKGTLDHIYDLDWTAKSRANLPYNPLSSVRRINLVDLISDNCASCLICSS